MRSLTRLPTIALGLATGILVSGLAPALAFDVTTYHYDTWRTGLNNQETVLTPRNVGSSAFHMLHSVALPEQVDAQPLVLSAATLAAWGYGTQFPHDVVYVVTASNDLLAIDSSTGAVLMRRNFGTPVATANLPGGCNNNSATVGITSTPVIDPVQKVMFLTTYTWENGAPVHRIHRVSALTLADATASVVITATAKLSDGSTLAFNPSTQRQRSALLMANGNIYAGFGSFCDQSSSKSRGWMLGWSAASLAPLVATEIPDKQTTAQAGNGLNFPGWTTIYYLSSTWMSGYGPSADSSGNVYFQTGNSDASNNFNYPDSLLKMSSDLSTVVDYFTPANFATLDDEDADLGSGGVMVVPDQANGLKFAVGGGKDGRLFLYNRASLGHYVAGGPDVPKSVSQGGCWCGPAYFVGSDGRSRIVSTGGTQLQSWILPTTATGNLTLEAGAPVLSTSEDPGGQATVSSNGTQANSAIIWGVPHASNGLVYLQAVNATAGSGYQSVTDGLGNVWSFSTATDGNGTIILRNGSSALYTSGVKIVISASGTMWHQNVWGNWYSYNGTGWTYQQNSNGPNVIGASAPGTTITPASGGSVVDSDGNVWSFGSATQSTGTQILENGSGAMGGYGVKMVIDSDGTMWSENAQNNWSTSSGVTWWDSHGTSGPTTGDFTPGASIVPASGGSVIDAQGNIWSFSSVTDVYGTNILRNGSNAIYTSGVKVVIDGSGTMWHENTQNNWYSFNGTGWTSHGSTGPTVARTFTVGSTATSTAGGSVVDAQGNTWTFGSVTDSNGRQFLLNGSSAMYLRAVKLVIDVTGRMWQLNAVGNWYSYDGVQFMSHPNSNGPDIAIPSEAGSTIFNNGAALQELLLVPAGVWPNDSTNANIVPVVANDKVYVASYKTLTIWGLAN